MSSAYMPAMDAAFSALRRGVVLSVPSLSMAAGALAWKRHTDEEWGKNQPERFKRWRINLINSFEPSAFYEARRLHFMQADAHDRCERTRRHQELGISAADVVEDKLRRMSQYSEHLSEMEECHARERAAVKKWIAVLGEEAKGNDGLEHEALEFLNKLFSDDDLMGLEALGVLGAKLGLPIAEACLLQIEEKTNSKAALTHPMFDFVILRGSAPMYRCAIDAVQLLKDANAEDKAFVKQCSQALEALHFCLGLAKELSSAYCDCGDTK